MRVGLALSHPVDYWWMRFLLETDWLIGGRTELPHRRHGEIGWRRNSAVLRLLMTDFALRAFRFDEGRLPDRLDELVPKYLRTVPQDPFRPTPTPLIYRRDGEGFQLYSVGPDEIDDGGKLTEISELNLGGDLLLESIILREEVNKDGETVETEIKSEEPEEPVLE